MRAFFALLGLTCWAVAALFFLSSKSAVHEILAAIVFLTGVVALGVCAICGAINTLAERPVNLVAEAELTPARERPVSFITGSQKKDLLIVLPAAVLLALGGVVLLGYFFSR